jgi:two-component system sensor kinase FixL
MPRGPCAGSPAPGLLVSWVTVVWSMAASACLTLAVVHLLVWSRRRTAWANLLFSLASVGTAGYAGCELWMMHSQTPVEFGTAVRWMHVPVWVLIVSLVGFTRVYLRAGRLWLAWAVFGARTLALLLNFGPAANLNYREMSALRHVPFLGEAVSVGEGVPNPWMLVGQLSLLLFVALVVDASLAAWRRGDRRQALVVGGSLVFFATGGALESVLVLWGIVQAPLTATLLYLGLLAAMGYELSNDVLRAARLSDDLRERDQQMTLAADAADLGLWVWATPQNTVWATEKLHPMLGFPHGESISLDSFLTSVHPEDREPTRRALQVALDEGSEYSTEYRVLLPDGRQRWIAARGRVEKPARDGAARMLGVCIDITARKRDEAEMLRLQADLAHAGRVSTMAQLASGLAHELNQPLGAILRNAEAAQLLLQSSPPDLEEVRAILADICKDDHRAGEVIDHMRSLLKRRGQERAELDFAELVNEVVVLLQPDAGSRKVRLAVEVPATLPPVRGDRVHLQQVLLNLILNGMDAMADVPAGQRRLVVRARQVDARTVEAAIADSGRGVAPAKLERLFEPFVTTKPDGLGLGLPISASIVAAHGGRIWAESGPAGATFFFTVPVSGEA